MDVVGVVVLVVRVCVVVVCGIGIEWYCCYDGCSLDVCVVLWW